jgi:DNA gyrase subunit A
VNGTSGIAVGMATNIPPHNLKETIDATIKIIDNKVEENRETDIDELIDIIKGPDFPTGAQILGKQGINEAYRTGRGKIKVRAITDIEPMSNGKQRIVVTELPYMVNKSLLIKNMVDLVKNKKIDGITDIRDESSREGMRVVIELRKDVNANVILNQLYKHTQLQDTFGCIMLALVDGVPKVLNIKQLLTYYLKHQEEVVTRRTKYELNKAEERAHILQGLLIALDNIDEVISIIRESKNVAEAKTRLMERFALSEAQASAIVDMRLRALTGLEREKLEAEYNELIARIAELKAILADENKLLGVIKDELTVIADKYGDERRTAITAYADDITDEELIKREEIVISMTKLGYIKRMPRDTFKVQNRGGKGIKGMMTIDNDLIDKIFLTDTHNYIMFFTNMGRVYRLKGYQIPESGRNARGVAIVNLLQLLPGENVTTIIPVAGFDKKYLMMATRKGIVKKTDISAFANIRKTGLTAITLSEDDELIEVKATSGENDVFVMTKKGMCIRFNESCVRQTGRSSMGVKGISLRKDDEVIAMQLDVQGDDILFVTKNGMGKRTKISEFSTQNRGGLGLKYYKITEKTGEVVSAKSVTDEHDIMMMTNEGIMIRMHCSDIPVIGRITSGVKLMNVDTSNNICVASVAKLARGSEEDEEAEDLETPTENADGVSSTDETAE